MKFYTPHTIKDLLCLLFFVTLIITHCCGTVEFIIKKPPSTLSSPLLYYVPARVLVSLLKLLNSSATPRLHDRGGEDTKRID